MDTAPRRNVGFEEAHFARLGRIADIVKSNAAVPGFDLYRCKPSWLMTRVLPRTSMYWLCTLGWFLTFEMTRGFVGSLTSTMLKP